MPTNTQYEDSLRDMKAWLALQADDVIKQVKIISSQTSGRECMLHIDKNKIDVFTPRVGASFEDDENSTVPRVTVAPTLVGCILGYSRCVSDFMTGHNISKRENPDDTYKQGYVLHRLDYLHCLKPTAKMVWDAPGTDEHWLVNYQPKHKEYVPVAIGEFYFTSMHFGSVQGKDSRRTAATTVAGYIRHTDKAGMLVHEGQRIAPGTYLFTFDLGHLYNPNKGMTKVEQGIVPCSESDYKQNKKLYAALLSEQAPPKHLLW